MSVELPAYRTRWAHTDRHRPRRTGEGAPHVLVIHTSEQAFPTVTNGETLADVMAGPKTPIPGTNPVRYNQASYHWAVDLDSINHMVAVADIDGRDDIAFHAPPNWHGEAICLTGRAGRDWTGTSDTVDDWPQLRLAARLVAGRLTARGWPAVKLTPAQVAAGEHGVCGHHDISVAFGQTDHTDPGAGFPWDTFLAMVRTHMTPTPPPSEEDDTMLKLIQVHGDPAQLILNGLEVSTAVSEEVIADLREAQVLSNDPPRPVRRRALKAFRLVGPPPDYSSVGPGWPDPTTNPDDFGSWAP